MSFLRTPAGVGSGESPAPSTDFDYSDFPTEGLTSEDDGDMEYTPGLNVDPEDDDDDDDYVDEGVEEEEYFTIEEEGT
jgi:hypothetical protein